MLWVIHVTKFELSAMRDRKNSKTNKYLSDYLAQDMIGKENKITKN